MRVLDTENEIERRERERARAGERDCGRSTCPFHTSLHHFEKR